MRFNMNRLLICILIIFINNIFIHAQTHPGIQQKQSSDPCWDFSGDAYVKCIDALNAGSSSKSCSQLCPQNCTEPIDSPLYKGTCDALIEECNGTPQSAICKCDGKGNAPFYKLGIKHLRYQKSK